MTTDKLPGATSGAEYSVSQLGWNSFKGKLSKAVNKQLAGPGTVVIQVPNGTSETQLRGLLQRYTGRPERLRVCANDRCRWAFFDSSPTGRRRWCDMRSCGNQAKAARYRARLKEESKSDEVSARPN